jgi:hypothetical protein
VSLQRRQSSMEKFHLPAKRCLSGPAGRRTGVDLRPPRRNAEFHHRPSVQAKRVDLCPEKTGLSSLGAYIGALAAFPGSLSLHLHPPGQNGLADRPMISR